VFVLVRILTVTFHGHDHEERAPSPLSLFEQPANRVFQRTVSRQTEDCRSDYASEVPKSGFDFGEIKADLRGNKGDANPYDGGGLDRIAGWVPL